MKTTLCNTVVKLAEAMNVVQDIDLLCGPQVLPATSVSLCETDREIIRPLSSVKGDN
jgi:hypothetical protein